MLRNKEYNKFIKFEKTIEDLFYDSGSGIFVEMGDTDDDNNFVYNNVPQFIQDGGFDLSLLDVSFYEKYSERWLNKTGGNCYSVDSDGELENPSDLSMLTQQLLDYFYKKWDNLYYLYYTIVMGTDYNPIENYSSNETTTYNKVTDAHTKYGADTDKIESEIKQTPLHTVNRVTDEYGTETGGIYTNGIKDTTEYARKYKTTDKSGDDSANPFVSTDEKGIAGMDSSGNYGSVDAGDIPASGGLTGYSQDSMNIHTELGEKSSEFADIPTDNKPPYESTERTGKHTSINESGGDIQNGSVVQGNPQTVTTLDKTKNYTEHVYNSGDTSERTGNITVTKTGNIGVMTASDMIQKFLESDYIRVTFLDTVFNDVANFISLQCY